MVNLNMMSDTYFMKHAIRLAEKGRWHTAPNPCVGAVLVHDNVIIAEGYHKKVGSPHAEIECLLDAIKQGFFIKESVRFSNPILAETYEKAKYDPQLSELAEKKLDMFSLRDCVLYVTLEPCIHHGKTPPCTQAIVEAGIKRVVVGMLDVNPLARGGVARLTSQGVAVTLGVLEDKCQELIKDFLTWQEKKRPYVILKMACSLDGRIGPQLGHNYKLSCPKTRQRLMKLRKNIGLAGGAVMVGAHTFAFDKPKLTARKTHDLNVSMPQALPVVVDQEVLVSLAQEESVRVPIAHERRMPPYKHFKQPYAVILSSKLPDSTFQLNVKNINEEILAPTTEKKNKTTRPPHNNVQNQAMHANSPTHSFASTTNTSTAYLLSNKQQAPQRSCLQQRPEETIWYCSTSALEESENRPEEESVVAKMRAQGVFVKGVSSIHSIKENKKELNLWEILESLYQDKNCPYVLCEGGPHLAMSLLKHGLVDELILYMSPIILGETGKPVFAGHSIDSMQSTLGFIVKSAEQVGEDIHIHLKQERTCSQD